MAPVPAWTREWRPLAKQLCVRLGGPNDDAAPQEALLLRADRVVGQLYAHRFMDSVPQDVKAEAQALATKFRVHSLEERADKLLQLVGPCDYRVLKLLLELAKAPTAASDQDVALDEDTDSRWTAVLQQEQQRKTQLQQTQEQLVEELFEISTNDEWYQAWSDSDEEDWDVSSNDEVEVDTRRRNGKRSSDVMEQEEVTSLDSRLSGVMEERVEQGLDFSQEVTTQDELLCRYFDEVPLHGEVMVHDGGEPTCGLEKSALALFTLERPWLLCGAVVKIEEGRLAERDIIPSRLIHEHTAVEMVFEALDGVDSLLFELRPVRPAPSRFSLDFQTKIAERSRCSFSVAIGHLSPLAFHNMLDDFAQAASELQLLRDLIGFIRRARDLSAQHRCVTLEGLANSLAEVVRNLSESIRKVEQQTTAVSAFPGDDPSPWSGINSRQPTLLGVYGGLKEIFSMVSWLKGILVGCFSGLSGRHWHEVKRAEQAKCVLDGLYCLMEIEYVEGAAAGENANAAGMLSRSNVLLHLFTGALSPYLDLLNRMLFERGHFETVPLDGELFFATPASMSVGASPMRERSQNFRDGLLSLAPFEVNRSLVPVFLESSSELMNEALASRQMKNRFLRHQQHSAEEPLTEPKQPRPSLRRLLREELESMGFRCEGGVLCVSAATVQITDEAPVPSDQVILECVPFNRIMERCLTRHIKSKCRELNGEITDIFRDKLLYLEHVEALRMFVLMEQQDVFNVFSERLVAHMQENPVAWADSEKINSFHQSAVQGVFEENALSSSQRQIGGRVCVRVDFNRLDGATGGTRIDVATMKCLHFTFSAPQPLRVLFSASIMQKYSRLGVFLIQVKAVESALVKFKSTLRHRRCYPFIEGDMRQLLIQIADMLHYTKSLLNYLTTQISSEGWLKYRQTLRSSRNLAEMDATHEQYLDHLLTRFFLLDKHAAVIQYIFTTFNHILSFVGHVDGFVSAVDRNMRKYFPAWTSDEDAESEQVARQSMPNKSTSRLLGHPDFRTLHAEIAKRAKEFKRQSHFLVVMLTAMQKHGASPHVNEIVTQLNFNFFYHQPERRPRAHVPLQQQQPVRQVVQDIQVPPLNRSGSLRPPPAPKKFSRTRSVHMP